MADAWARFVATGNPNGGNLPAWPAFAGNEAMVFGDTVAAGPVERLDAIRLPARCPRPL